MIYAKHLQPKYRLRERVKVIAVGFYYELEGEIINFAYDEDEDIVLYDVLFEDTQVYPQYKSERPGAYHVGVLREQDLEVLDD